MAIKILHLYKDLMNLYGEYANISILERRLNEQGIETEITKVDSCKDISFDDYDFIYIGGGTEKAQKAALADLMTKKDEFISAAKSGKIMLLTGNASELIGKSITDAYGKVYEGLALCPFETVESYKARLTGDAICTCRFLTEEFVGFINKCSSTKGVVEPMFTMQMGHGNSDTDKNEGCHIHNVFATHLIGPILVKNPHFTKYLMSQLTKGIEGFTLKDTINHFELGSYEITLRELKNRLNSTN